MKRQEEVTPVGASEPPNSPVICPFCGSADVELLSLFGSQLLTDQYYCHACRTPFEHLRADDDGQDGQDGRDEQQEQINPAGWAHHEE